MPKSVTLNKAMKEEMFHTFYRKATKEAREQVDAYIADLKNDFLDVLFGKYQPTLTSLPTPFRRRVKEIAMPKEVKAPKPPKARKKGKITPTDKTAYFLHAIAPSVHLFTEKWRPAMKVVLTIDHLPVEEKESEVYGPTWEDWIYRSWDRLEPNALKAKVVTRTQLDAFINKRFIPTCKVIDEIIAPVEETVRGVGAILRASRTTKSLREQWPEVDKYVELPVESQGAIARLVDVKHLNEVLEQTWPEEATS